MIFDRQRQRLLLQGKEYTAGDISRLVAEGAENCPPALWDLYLFLEKWFDASPVITVHTSGSTGTPKELVVRKDRMMQSARLTCEFLNLQAGDTALLCMNLRYIGAMMVVVRSLVAGLNLIVRPASGHPLSDIEEPLRFAAMVPLQVYNTLRVPEEKARLEQTDILIIGGTSLAVYPAAGLIDYYRGNKLVLVNKSPTPADRRADLVIHAPIGEVFSQL